MAKKSNEENVLCELTDWIIPPAGGRGKPSTTPQRKVIQCYKFGWGVGTEREGYPPVGEAGNCCFAELAGAILRTGVPLQIAAEKISESLARNLKMKPIKIDLSLSPSKIFASIDEYYGVNCHKAEPNEVRHKVFGKAGDADENSND